MYSKGKKNHSIGEIENVLRAKMLISTKLFIQLQLGHSFLYIPFWKSCFAKVFLAD